MSHMSDLASFLGRFLPDEMALQAAAINESTIDSARGQLDSVIYTEITGVMTIIEKIADEQLQLSPAKLELIVDLLRQIKKISHQETQLSHYHDGNTLVIAQKITKADPTSIQTFVENCLSLKSFVKTLRDHSEFINFTAIVGMFIDDSTGDSASNQDNSSASIEQLRKNFADDASFADDADDLTFPFHRVFEPTENNRYQLIKPPQIMKYERPIAYLMLMSHQYHVAHRLFKEIAEKLKANEVEMDLVDLQYDIAEYHTSQINFWHTVETLKAVGATYEKLNQPEYTIRIRAELVNALRLVNAHDMALNTSDELLKIVDEIGTLSASTKRRVWLHRALLDMSRGNRGTALAFLDRCKISMNRAFATLANPVLTQFYREHNRINRLILDYAPE